MQRNRTSRITGILFMVGAALGIVLSLAGLVFLWATRASVTRSIGSTVELLGRALDATGETVEVAANAVELAIGDLEAMRNMIDQVGTTLEDSEGMILSASNVIGEDMVEIVGDTQTSLKSVEGSARFIDDFLRVVSSIPFIGARYTPEMTLQEAFSNVNESLDPLTGQFEDIQRDLDVASANVAVMRSQIEGLSDQIGGINDGLKRAQDNIEDYRGLIADVNARWSRLENRLPLALTASYLIITALLIWMLITQAGMLLHGMSLLRSPLTVVENPRPEERVNEG